MNVARMMARKMMAMISSMAIMDDDGHDNNDSDRMMMGHTVTGKMLVSAFSTRLRQQSNNGGSWG